MIETTQHVLGCWEMVDWRELNPRPHLAPCGSQGIGAKSVRFFTLHTTRQDTDSAFSSSGAVALLPKIDPSKHVAAGFLHQFATQKHRSNATNSP
ncbi:MULTISPECIES: hypothetical protein [Comamonas]|uniref:hypothetical protein n=1 Tax=Comamonas TaxID=283 RepID=UPI00103ED8EC|nr:MULTISPECIES: hypothetical protein [Comamonas]TYK71079.1 hypothetical protein FSY45_23740 [Comamonas sp. Z1]